VVVAIVVVAVLLFNGGGGYTVRADFQNAAQLVKGNVVEIGGTQAGTIDDIKITSDGQAEIKMTVDDAYKPLPQGTQAVIRQSSQSSIAGRYIELELPGANQREGNIADGGKIPITRTTTTVDLDQLFNTLDPPTRSALKALFVNSAKQFKGKTAQQALAYHYLNPALSTSSRLFGELNRDSPLLSRFLQDSSTLVTALAQRKDQLTALIGNANKTFRALGNQRIALEEAITRLPNFMRQANTTFVNLRAALNDVDPFVNASKPVAKKLGPFLAQLRPLARDARPTVRDLSNTVLRKGPDNDLLDLQQSFPALASTALDTKARSVNAGGGAKDVGTVKGAFPETTKALIDTSPIVAFGRPYTPDLFGWFDDFSTSGQADAGGGFSRSINVFNALNPTSAVPSIIPLDQRNLQNSSLIRLDQFRRCPGGGDVQAPDGSNVLSADQQKELDCTEKDRAAGDVTP
jgi:phospholipid/cholesterol/gamma-HCH transport system substrate-binding protein